MPRTLWSLRRGRPIVQVVLTTAMGGQKLTRTLLADTGAGARHVTFELALSEQDCLQCGGILYPPVALGGALTGVFPTYDILVEIPSINFARYCRAVGVTSVFPGMDGFACFSFLNRFTYGNFGDPDKFGLER